MIARFPSFSPLDLKYRDEVRSITSRFEPYSDFNFVSLFSWSGENGAEMSMLNNNLVIRLPDYLTGEPVLSILGTTDLEDSISMMLEITPNIKLVPEIVIRCIGPMDGYTFEEDRNNNDYVFDVESLANMSGSDYKKKRNKANRVKQYFGSRLSLEPTQEIDGQIVDELFVEWVAENEKSDENTLSEHNALRRLLANSDSLGLHAVIVYLDDRPQAFSIHEILPGGYAICHFEKVLKAEHPDLATYLVGATAKKLQDLGVVSVNWEQDLGIPGLRQSKMSYKPINYLRKYSLKRAL